MEVFVARQAIFDQQLKVYGYELLHRSCQGGTTASSADARASLQVVANSFLSIGAENVLSGKRAFINFPEELLLTEGAFGLPQEITVIEILESVQPQPAVIDACRALRQQGYVLALDDFLPGDSDWDELLDLVSIIKIDFRATTTSQQRLLATRYAALGIHMLAEKIESQREFQDARAMGYEYFQGYFFARPAVLSRHEIPVSKVTYLNMLSEISRSDLDYPAIEALIHREVSLACKLLRFVNSAMFGLESPTQSIGQALNVLGEQKIRHWASLASLAGLTVDKPDELMRLALVRAHFCELLAPSAGLGHRKSELFLMGLFSLLDAMLDRPLRETLADMRLQGEIAETLLRHAPANSRIAGVYALVREYEGCDWPGLTATADRMGVPREAIPEYYLRAVAFSEQTLQG